MKILAYSSISVLFILAACSSSPENGENYIGAGCSEEGKADCSWDNSVAITCEGGLWALKEDCSAAKKVCQNGACVTESKPGDTCEGNTKKCGSNKILACENNAFVVKEDCGAEKICKDNNGNPICEEKPEVPDTAGGTDTDTPKNEGSNEGSGPDVDQNIVNPEGDDDKDGIPNGIEGTGDYDGDSLPNYLDSDSDNDGISDQEECPAQPCRNNDKDDMPDFLDKDSDNDGLTDEKELVVGTDPTKKDTDGDGSDDLAEIVYEENNPGGADPLDPTKSIPEGIFYVVLPYVSQEDVQRTLSFDTTIESIDIGIILDKSASMSEEMDQLGNELATKVINGIKEKVDNVAFGASWLSWNPPFAVVSDITADAQVVGSYISGIPADGDNEMHSLALFLTATGAEFHDKVKTCLPGMGGCNQSYVADVAVDIPKHDCTGELGSIGGLCFRKKSMIILMMVSDEGWTECIKASDPITNWTGCRYMMGDGVRKKEAIAAMNGIGAKFIGIDTGFDDNGNKTDAAKEDYEEVAQGTYSLDKQGKPFLYHTANPNGTGISTQVAQAVKDLTTYIDMDVTTGSLADAKCDGTSTAEFVKSSTTVKAEPASGVSGQDEKTFFSVKQGTVVTFDVRFYNDFCKNMSNKPISYDAYVTVLGNGAYLSSRLVHVIVPETPQE